MPTRDQWRSEVILRAKKDGAISTFELESNPALAHAFTDLMAEGVIVSLPSVYPIQKFAAKEALCRP